MRLGTDATNKLVSSLYESCQVNCDNGPVFTKSCVKTSMCFKQVAQNTHSLPFQIIGP